MSSYGPPSDLGMQQPSMLSQVGEGMQGTMQFASNAATGAYQSMMTGAHYGASGIQSAHQQIVQYQEMYQQVRQGYMGDMHLLNENVKTAASQFYDPTRNMGNQLVHGASYAAATGIGWGIVGKLPGFGVGSAMGRAGASFLGFGAKGLAAGGMGLVGGLAGMFAPFMAIDHLVEGVMENAAQREEMASAIGRYSQVGINPLHRTGNASVFNRAQRLGLARDMQDFTHDLDKQDFGQFKMGMDGSSQVLNAFGPMMFRDPSMSPDKFREGFQNRVKMVREFAIAFDKTIEESIQLIKQLSSMTGDLRMGGNPTQVAALIGQAGNVSGVGSQGIMQLAAGAGQTYLGAGLTSGQGALSAIRNIGDLGTMRNQMMISNVDFMRVGGLSGAAQQMTQMGAQFTAGSFGQVFAAAALQNGAVNQGVLSNIASGKMDLTQAINAASGIGGGGLNALSNFYANQDTYKQAITPLQQQGMIGQSALQMLQMTGMQANQANLATVFQSQFGMSSPMARTLATQMMNPQLYVDQQRAAINVAHTRIQENEISQNSLGNYLYRKTGMETAGNWASNFMYNIYSGGGDIGNAAGNAWRNMSDYMTGNVRFNMEGAGTLSDPDMIMKMGKVDISKRDETSVEETVRKNFRKVNAAMKSMGTFDSISGFSGRNAALYAENKQVKDSGYSSAEIKMMAGFMGRGIAGNKNDTFANFASTYYTSSDDLGDDEIQASYNLLKRRDQVYREIHAGARLSPAQSLNMGSGKVADGVAILAKALVGRKKITTNELVGLLRKEGLESNFGLKRGEGLDNALGRANLKAIGAATSLAGVDLDTRDDTRMNALEMRAVTDEARLAEDRAAIDRMFDSPFTSISGETINGKRGFKLDSVGYRIDEEAGLGYAKNALLASFGDLSSIKSADDRSLFFQAGRALVHISPEESVKQVKVVLGKVLQRQGQVSGAQKRAFGALATDLTSYLTGGSSSFYDQMMKTGLSRDEVTDHFDRSLKAVEQSEVINAKTKTYIQFGYQTTRELETINQDQVATAAGTGAGGGKDVVAATKAIFATLKGISGSDNPQVALMDMSKKLKEDAHWKRAAQGLSVMPGGAGRIGQLITGLAAIGQDAGLDYFAGGGKSVAQFDEKFYNERLKSQEKGIAQQAYQDIEASLSKTDEHKLHLSKVKAMPGWDKKTAAQKGAMLLTLARNDGKRDQSILLGEFISDHTGKASGEVNVAGTHVGAQAKVNERILSVLGEQYRSLEQHRVVMETLNMQIRAMSK